MTSPARYLATIEQAYSILLGSQDPPAEWPTVRHSLDPWPTFLLTECLGSTSNDVLQALESVAPKVAELLVLHYAGPGTEHQEDMSRLLEGIKRLVGVGEHGKPIARALLTGLIVGLEAFPSSVTQQVIDCLAELVGLDIGTIPRHPVDDKPRGQPAPDLHDLLHAALCAEVRRFCTARNVKSIAPDFEDVVARISCPVVSVGSRKGGTGKSVLLAAIISWFKRRRPDSRVCLLDLDLSGPIWQYLLFPSRNSPGRFLDDILDLHQRPFGFRFPVPTPNGIIELVRKAPCPFSLGTEVSHLGVRDLPSINRLLLLAAEMSRTDFYTFIARVIEQLSASHELILIDNSPGFDSIPLCTHTIASSAMRGAALVVSTPALPDLAGTFLELADLRLIEFKRPPFWIVNKATACSRDFLSHKWSAYQIAKMLKAYDGVLPETPLIASALRPSDVTNFWHAVSMDESLLDFSFLDGTGHAKMPDLARTRFGKETEALFNRVLAPIVD